MSKKYPTPTRYKPKNPEKYRGDADKIWSRSSWEFKVMRWCDSNPNIVEWSSEEVVIPYICKTDGRKHRYFIDFMIKVVNKEGIIKTYLVEVKPKKETLPPVPPKRKSRSYSAAVLTFAKNTSKWTYAEAYCKERGMEFMIITEDHLGV